ncbi:TPA: MFS transporter [Enterococcus faecium]|uniref:MFS transporter n=1 Tax=Enterococcus faecium TaxID=1352 RepID=UPI000B3E8AB1|nr:MFS transporter [Enterococcus faecium]MCZ1502979.1 sugar porter family MFS transporter [Enterococcus faecium]NTK67990.1 MFS transporter [Enterococcus faecium]NTQ64063.1 MFS transporter [Enterococcus faecium]HBA0409867.1 sugar porter family MFS transporter [Enterococcus faecium]
MECLSLNKKNNSVVKKYSPLATAAGIGSMLGSGCIVGLSATIPVWQKGLELTTGQVGILSGSLTFAIAFGSMFAGNITRGFGLIRSFNWLNLFYGIGAAICIFSTSFLMLLAGLIIMGISSGADLPISLTVVSHDVPDETTSAQLVSSTQIFWQIGVFISYICSFLLSGVQGVLGARLVFAILFGFAVITWLWRTFSTKFKTFHEEGYIRQAANKVMTEHDHEVSFKTVLFGENKRKYLGFFLAIITFYVCWNLLANTWGQFQTYALTNAGASQTQATGLGIILNVVALGTTIVFTSISGGKYRNKAFFVGAFVQFAAMLGMVLIGGGAGFIALATTIAFYNFGNPLAGEAIYKVWTQESFPAETRASLQGFINGFSRLCCGLFAFVTPYLVMPDHIQSSMIGFAGIVLVATIAGIVMMRLQKKYGTSETRGTEDLQDTNVTA